MTLSIREKIRKDIQFMIKQQNFNNPDVLFPKSVTLPVITDENYKDIYNLRDFCVLKNIERYEENPKYEAPILMGKYFTRLNIFCTGTAFVLLRGKEPLKRNSIYYVERNKEKLKVQKLLKHNSTDLIFVVYQKTPALLKWLSRFHDVLNVNNIYNLIYQYDRNLHEELVKDLNFNPLLEVFYKGGTLKFGDQVPTEEVTFNDLIIDPLTTVIEQHQGLFTITHPSIQVSDGIFYY